MSWHRTEGSQSRSELTEERGIRHKLKSMFTLCPGFLMVFSVLWFSVLKISIILSLCVSSSMFPVIFSGFWCVSSSILFNLQQKKPLFQSFFICVPRFRKQNSSAPPLESPAREPASSSPQVIRHSHSSNTITLFLLLKTILNEWKHPDWWLNENNLRQEIVHISELK